MKDPAPVTVPAQSAPLARPAVSAPLPQAPAPPFQYVTNEANAGTAQRNDSGLAVTVRTMGIVALSLMLVGFIPCLGWLNYLNLLLCFITIVIGIVAIVNGKSDAERTSALLGLGFVTIAIFLGIIRLILGGGCV